MHGIQNEIFTMNSVFFFITPTEHMFPIILLLHLPQKAIVYIFFYIFSSLLPATLKVGIGILLCLPNLDSCQGHGYAKEEEFPS